MERHSETASEPTSGQNPVRELRSQLGLTQEEFAHAIAVTVSTVNRWENGHANPSSFAAVTGAVETVDACTPLLCARAAASGLSSALKVRLRVSVRVKYLLIMG